MRGLDPGHDPFIGQRLGGRILQTLQVVKEERYPAARLVQQQPQQERDARLFAGQPGRGPVIALGVVGAQLQLQLELKDGPIILWSRRPGQHQIALPFQLLRQLAGQRGFALAAGAGDQPLL